MTEKQRIRAQIETLRRTFEPSQAEMASEQIIEQLLDLPVLETARTLALYLAFAGEVNLDGLFPPAPRAVSAPAFPYSTLRRTAIASRC